MPRLAERPPTALKTSAVSRAEFERLCAEVRDLRAIVERRQGPRDRADQQLLSVLPRTTCGLPFYAAELLEHAGAHPELAAALEACDLCRAGEVGCWLRRMRGAWNGIRITRLGREGRWQATDMETSMSAIGSALP